MDADGPGGCTPSPPLCHLKPLSSLGLVWSGLHSVSVALDAGGCCVAAGKAGRELRAVGDPGELKGL